MNDTCDKIPLVLIGGGGHAAVLVDILLRQNRKIAAVISPEPIDGRSVLSGLKRFSQDEDVERFAIDEVKLVCGIGMMPNSGFRTKLINRFIDLGYHFETVVSNDAIVSEHVKLEDGVQVMPGCIIQAGVTVGQHSIVNTGALLEHDCVIGPFNHVAPRAVLCGEVRTEENVYIGANATLTQCVAIAKDSVVGASAILTESLKPASVLYPAKSVKKEK